MAQIQKRGRPYEDAMRIDYLKNLNKHYERWIEGYSESRLLVIDINNLDFVTNIEDFAFIIDKIELELHSLFD